MTPRATIRAARPIAALLVLAVALSLSACAAPQLAPPGPGSVGGSGGGADPGGARLERGRLVTADGLSLPLRSWQPAGGPKAVILALHGFNDYSKAFEDPARDWAAVGIATYAYDQRGFGAAPYRGLWAGSDALTGDLADAARALKARHPQLPLYLLGDSMGGAVILAAMASDDPPAADGVVLAAPAVWARSAMPWYQRSILWLSAHGLPSLELSGRGLKIQASDNIEMLRGLGRDPLVIKETRVDAVYGLVDLMDKALAAAPAIEGPALLLYGQHDEIVPRDPTFQLWRDLPAAQQRVQRQALYDDGWHMLLRDLDAQTVREDVAAWIADPAAPLPSGADARAAAALAAPADMADSGDDGS